MMTTRVGRTTAFLALLVVLSGCALTRVPSVDAGKTSGEAFTVVTGRINYVIDGRFMSPYGMFSPSWQAPPMSAVSLETGDPHVFPQVSENDGAFRWQLPPGAYVISNIGMGTFGDEKRIVWPRLVLCVPRAPGATVYVGHLRLEGARYEEEVRLSTGTQYTARGVHYRFVVADEVLAQRSQVKRLMRHVPDMPIGEQLVERWRKDAKGLEQALCGEIVR